MSQKEEEEADPSKFFERHGISSFLKLHQLENGGRSSNLGRKKIMLKQSLQRNILHLEISSTGRMRKFTESQKEGDEEADRKIL